jgi:putative transposase
VSYKAFKYRLYPNENQKELLEKHFGCVRYVYNKALSLKNQFYQENKENLTRRKISEKVTSWKKEEETKWLKEVNSQSLQFALINLETAFVNFFKKKANFPKFKKKSNRQSFSCPQSCNVDFENSRFFLPKFKEGIKCVFHRSFEGKIKTCTVSKTPTGKYFVSILVDLQNEETEKLPISEETCLGIDLGIKNFATFSNGEKIENPKFLEKKLKKLKRENRRLSRKKKGSKNRNKQRVKLAKQYEKVTNYRKDFQHKVTRKIVDNQNYTSVSLETLGIKDMLKNNKLSRQISDAAWFQFKTFLKYKLEEKGKSLLEIGRFEPSSKMCSCGNINTDLKLSDRTWTCKSCNTSHDRDVLAANNIKKFAFLGKDYPELTLLEIAVTQS